MKFDDLTSDFEIAPEGPAIGVLVTFIDRGMQSGKFNERRQAALRWELPGVTTESGEPCIVFQTIFNLSMRSKALREVAKGLLGETAGLSLSDMVGKAAKLTIVHSERDEGTYANIASITPLKPGVKVPKHETKELFFSLDPNEYDETKLDLLSEAERKRVLASPTFKETQQILALRKKPTAEIIQDELPWDDAVGF
jgi:hypothetical protein